LISYASIRQYRKPASPVGAESEGELGEAWDDAGCSGIDEVLAV
jgi:hypothetical protein